MSFQIDVPEDMSGGGNFLEAPGKYHMVVTGVSEGCEGKENQITPGITVDLEVQNGEHKEKTIRLRLRSGNLTHKDKGEFARKKQAAFLIATNVLDVALIGKPAEVDLEKATRAQLFVELEQGDPDDKGRRWLDVKFLSLYHIDDPRAKDFPRDEQVLALVNKEYRRSPAYFEPILGKRASGTGQPPKTDKDFEGL